MFISQSEDQGSTNNRRMADRGEETIPSSIQHLSHVLLEIEFGWRGKVAVAVILRLLRYIPHHTGFTYELGRAENYAKDIDIVNIWFFMQYELKNFFSFALFSPTETNQGLLSFIYFVLDITSEDLVNSKPGVIASVKDEISILRQEMMFLIPYLVTPWCSTELKALASDVARFMHSFFFLEGGSSQKKDPSLPDLLGKLRVMKAKIQDNCCIVSDVLWNIIPGISWHWKGRLIILVLTHSHSIKWSLRNTEASISLRDLQSFSEGDGGLICMTKIMSFVQENLKEFFSVSNYDTSRADQIFSSFVNFLLEIKDDVIMQYRNEVVDPIKDHIEVLFKELRFLVTLSGDAQFLHTEHEENRSTLAEIEVLLNHAGSFFHSLCCIDEATTNTINLKLSDLLEKFEILPENFKEQLILAPKLPYSVAPKLALGLSFTNDSLLDDLSNLMDLKADLMADVKDRLNMLHDKLMSSTYILKDMKGKQNAEVERFEQFHIQITNVAHEAECLINYFADQDLPLWYLKCRISLLIEQMEFTKVKLEELNTNSDILNLAEEFKKFPSQALVQPAKSSSVEDVIVGNNKQATKIAGQLIGAAKHLEIISIFGMPGLGKTTLAQRLYHNRAVVCHFDKLVWCVVSQTYEKRGVFVDICSSLVSSDKMNKILKKEDEIIGEHIYKTLKGRRYLIVLDDIWDIKAWDDLHHYFPDDENGSKILLTSRFKDVAQHASSDDGIVQLSFLSDGECWELLQKKVFGKEECPLQLRDTGMKIAALCEGLPLAVVAIAAVLSNRQEATFWDEVASNLSLHISEGPNKCMHILELSYKHLPLHLKPCFLYIAAFPKASNIPVEKLIYFWIAEGFIQNEDQKSLEDAAECYLIDLIDRSLVLVGERRSIRGIKTCKVHDLVRDLCLKIANEERFLNFIHGDNQFSTYRQQYRLSRHSISFPSYSVPVNLHIRSLLGCLIETSGLKFLIVLDLWDMEGMKKPKLRTIKMCVLLRYLAVPYWVDSISCLEKLEFLYVNSEFFDMQDLVSMRKLRVVSFKHINIRAGSRAFDGLCFQHLHSLSGFTIYHQGEEEILRCFPHLLKLELKIHPSITGLDLDFLNKLESLSLSKSSGYTKFIGMINYPQNLKELHLASLRMTNEDMSAIGKLACLELLKLYACHIGRGKWHTSDGEFQQLRILILDFLYDIEEWNMESGESFPVLERLVLRRGHNIEIPSGFGTHPTLQIIELHNCSNSTEESAKRIQEEQEEFGNEVNLIISR